MPHVYVGNPTRQPVTFMYRKLEHHQVLRQDIPMGGQIKIAGDLSPEDITYIVKQYQKYGIVRADEMDSQRKFVGLCYSLDRPISMIRLERQMQKNHYVLADRGKETRRLAAIAESNRMENAVIESGLPERLTTFEATIVEHNHDDRSGVAPISEGIRVTRNAHPDGSPKAPAKARGRRKAA